MVPIYLSTLSLFLFLDLRPSASQHTAVDEATRDCQSPTDAVYVSGRGASESRITSPL